MNTTVYNKPYNHVLWHIDELFHHKIYRTVDDLPYIISYQKGLSHRLPYKPFLFLLSQCQQIYLYYPTL